MPTIVPVILKTYRVSGNVATAYNRLCPHIVIEVKFPSKLVILHKIVYVSSQIVDLIR